jgi:hypothetical protein
MKHDDSSSSHRSLEQRLLHLLQAVRDTRDTSARAELNTLLRENADARSTMARLMVDEQALISRLRDDSIVALLEPAPKAETVAAHEPALVRVASAHRSGGRAGHRVVQCFDGVWFWRAFVGKSGVALCRRASRADPRRW